MELTELIQHPEMMDKETLYDLRSLIALLRRAVRQSITKALSREARRERKGTLLHS